MRNNNKNNMFKKRTIFDEARNTILFEYLTGRIDRPRYIELDDRINSKEEQFKN